MLTFLLTLAAISAYFLARRHPKGAIYLIAALIPTYLFRFNVGVIPANFLELMIFSTVIGSGFSHLGSLTSGSRIEKIGSTLLIIGLICGVVMAPDQLAAAGIVKGWFLFPALYAWLIYRHLDRADIPKLMLAVGLGALPQAVTALYQIVSQQFITVDHRASGWFSSPNYLALFLVPAILLAIGAIRGKHLVWTIALILTLLAALIATQSTAGIIALAIGIMAYLLIIRAPIGRGNGRGWLIGIGVSLSLAAVALYPRLADLINLGQRSSASVRLQVWEVASYLLQGHWFTGIGLGGFKAAYPVAAGVIFHPPLEWSMLHAHNLLLETWLGLGLLGTIGAVVLVVQWLYFGFIAPRSQVVVALLATLIAILAHGMVDTPYFKNDLAHIFWVVIACIYVAKKPTSLQYRD